MTLYLDSAATTAVTQPVLDAMLPYFTEAYGNPSSLHDFGRRAKRAVNKAREQFANAINADPEQIFFTSGATESNNIVRHSHAIVASAFEHPSMSQMRYTTIDSIIDAADVLYGFSTDITVCWQYVNSETGAIFPIERYAELVHSHGAKIHSDCTSAFGKINIDVKELDLDFASFSGHKFHAPKGVGVLYIKDPTHFHNYLTRGGGQEDGKRHGTENVPAIVGLGKAAELYKWTPLNFNSLIDTRMKLLNSLAKKMKAKYMVLTASENIPNIICLALKDINGESVMLALDSLGICVSTGSACHSSSDEVTPMIKSFNLSDDYLHGIVRISFDSVLTDDEIEYFTDKLAEVCEALS